MTAKGYMRTSINQEAGFTVAEVLVAALILVIAILPMAGMFDGAYLVSRAAADINKSGDCLRMYVESVKNFAFYEAHTTDDVDEKLDIDDYYWGRSPSPGSNSWTNAPYVLIKAPGIEPYPDMRVEIKMSYLDEEVLAGSLEQAANDTVMDSGWSPNGVIGGLFTYGSDRPRTAGGKSLNLVMYEVRVTATGSGITYTDVELLASPTDVVMNVYIDKVVNVSPDESKKGTRTNSLDECISAPHNKPGILIRAYGEGFTEAQVDSGLVDLKLVRVDDADLELSSMTYGEEGSLKYLEGSIDLNDGGIRSPWGDEPLDYRAPGNWNAWLVVNHVISVRNDAFIVEYPLPVYSATSTYHDSDNSDGDKSGLESTEDEVLTFTNLSYFTDLVPYIYPNPGIGAIVILVHSQLDSQGQPLDFIIGTNETIAPAGNGYDSGITATATFDFTGHIGGYYMVRIVNCVTRATPDIEVPGNTYIELDDPTLYYYLDGPPRVDEVYVYEETPASTELRHFGYDDRPYTYTLEIKGYNFDNLISGNDIIMGIGGDISADPPAGATNEITPVTATAIDSQTLQATFDFGPNVEDSERGQYWLYVRNSNGFGWVLNPAFDVRQPAPIIYSCNVDSSSLYGCDQNYYGTILRITGECFDSDLISGNLFEVRIREVTEPTNDWLATEAMPAYSSQDSGRLLYPIINLIDCDTGTWEIYGKSIPGNLTDSGYTDFQSGIVYASYLDINAGAPMLLTENIPITGEPWSISAQTRCRQWNPGGWGDWSSWSLSYEGDGASAWVWESDANNSVEDRRTQGVVYFPELRGMGFNKGQITIEAKNSSGENSPGMNATWIVAVNCSRATALVWIEMIESDALATGPDRLDSDEENPITVRIKNNNTSEWSTYYTGRIEVRYH